MTQVDTYSRFVGLLKVLLPLLALAMLSTLFLVARTVDPAQDLPYADVDIQELAEQPRINQPNFSTVTRDGTAISLAADSAVAEPSTPERIVGSNMRVRVDLPDQRRIDVVSGNVAVDHGAKTVRLSGSVAASGNAGFSLETGAIDINFDNFRLSSNAPAILTGPEGRVSADSFAMTKRPESDTDQRSGYVLVFKGNVKLVYDPNG